MSPQMLPQSERARLNLPYEPERPEPLPPPARLDGPRAEASLAARFASRRAWLTGLTGGALAPPAPPEPAPRRDPVLTLVQRITQGFNLAEYERAKALGFQRYLDEQLDHLAIDDSVMDGWLAQYPVITLSPKEAFDAFGSSTTDASRQLKGAMMSRATGSRRQLFERMCEFWTDHFNIDHNKDLEWMLLPEHERTVIRPHALGSFPAMLSACAFSGAMLFYLDNWLNERGAPQENYARELLELHTLSLVGGYNETDVEEVAKCFTGWTLNGDASSPDWLRGRFDESLHTPGEKLVLGHVIAAYPAVRAVGRATPIHDAQAVLDILAAHPSTARFLAQKLIRWFLTPTPPPALVEQVAEAYLDTSGDIKAMLRVILTRENLAPRSPLVAPKYRRPFHFMVSILRALDGRIGRPDEALSHLNVMGQAPYDCVRPTGYPDDFQAWNAGLLSRWTFSAAVLHYGFLFRGVRLIDPDELRARLELHSPADRPGLAGRMNERLFGETLSPYEVALLQDYIDAYPRAYELEALYDTMALASSLPGYQWY